MKYADSRWVRGQSRDTCRWRCRCRCRCHRHLARIKHTPRVTRTRCLLTSNENPLPMPTAPKEGQETIAYVCWQMPIRCECLTARNWNYFQWQQFRRYLRHANGLNEMLWEMEIKCSKCLFISEAVALPSWVREGTNLYDLPNVSIQHQPPLTHSLTLCFYCNTSEVFKARHEMRTFSSTAGLLLIVKTFCDKDIRTTRAHKDNSRSLDIRPRTVP